MTEQSKKFALAALDEALRYLNVKDLPATQFAIQEAIEQLEGRATP